jgi:hypothetical protein
VNGDLDLSWTNIESFGKLKFLFGDLWLNTPLWEKYSEEEIREMFVFNGRIIYQ